MADPDKAKLRKLSEAAFGQQYRLECMLEIGLDLRRAVSLTDLADRVGLRASQIQGAFKALVDVGLLSPAPAADRRRKAFQPVARSAAWRWAAEIAETAATPPASE